MISATEVFERIDEYLKKNYVNIARCTMPYCSLSEDKIKGKTVFRVELRIEFVDQEHPKSAIAEVDPNTGNILLYQEGFTWQCWT